MSEIVYKNSNGRFAEATVYNGIVYVAGQVGNTREADVTTQTKEVLEKIDCILAENGSDKEHVLMATVVLKDMSTEWLDQVIGGNKSYSNIEEGELFLIFNSLYIAKMYNKSYIDKIIKKLTLGKVSI